MRRFKLAILARFLALAFAFGFNDLAFAENSKSNMQFTLNGVTVYEPSWLLSFSAHAVAQTDGDITGSSLAERIAIIYREDGYFLAEVFVEPDGRTLTVDEGEIGELIIEGVDDATYRLISDYMSPVVGKRPLTQKEFERAVMLVEDIESVSATVEIDFAPGATSARARVAGSATAPSRGYATLDNPPRELGQASILTLNQEFLGVLAPGDRLRFEGAGTIEYDGSSDSLWGALMYRTPIGGYGAYVEGYYGTVTASRDRSGDLLATEIDGDTAIVALGYPVIRDVDTYGYGLAEWRKTTSNVDVSGTKFDSGVEVGGASWIYGKALPHGGALEYAINVSFGHRITEASGFDDGDEDFYHLRAGWGLEYPGEWFGPNSTFSAEVWGQYTDNRLPEIEKFYIGGREEERGYLFAEALGDIGLSATIEAGRDFFPGGIVKRIRPFGFFDFGYVENNDPTPDLVDNETFVSVGLGFDMEFPQATFVRSYVALPTIDGPSTDAGHAAAYLALTKSW
jgi:hemolysin activation/secretion protein